MLEQQMPQTTSVIYVAGINDRVPRFSCFARDGLFDVSKVDDPADGTRSLGGRSRETQPVPSNCARQLMDEGRLTTVNHD